jgi:hypothetical protein
MPSYGTETSGSFGGSPASLDYVTTQGGLLAALAEPPTGSGMGAHIAETVAPTSCTAALTMSTGVLSIAAIRLVTGQSVQGCGFVTSTQAGVTMTHWWTCLLDSGYICRAASADQTSGAIAASTWFSQAFGTAYTAGYTGIYFLGIMVAASTIPTLCGSTAPLAAMVTGTGAPAPLLGGVSTTGLTTAPTAGTTTFIAPTAAAVTPYLFAY